MIGVILFIFVNKKSKNIPCIIILNLEDSQGEKGAMYLINENTKKYLVKVKTVSKTGTELTVDVRLKSDSTEILNYLLKIKGVSNAVLVSYNGEYYG